MHFQLAQKLSLLTFILQIYQGKTTFNSDISWISCWVYLNCVLSEKVTIVYLSFLFPDECKQEKRGVCYISLCDLWIEEWQRILSCINVKLDQLEPYTYYIPDRNVSFTKSISVPIEISGARDGMPNLLWQSCWFIWKWILSNLQTSLLNYILANKYNKILWILRAFKIFSREILKRTIVNCFPKIQGGEGIQSEK